MTMDLLNQYLKKIYISTQYILIVVGLCFLSSKAFSQKKQLTNSNKVTKVALIDHSRLRKEYKS